MRIENVEYKVYKYDELTDDAKERVRQWLLSCREAPEFSDMAKDRLRYEYGLIDPEIEFSLGYCQGDGLNIYGEFTLDEIKTLLEKSGCFDFTPKEWRTIEFYYKQVYNNIKIPSNKCGYTYDYSDHIDIFYDWVDVLYQDCISGVKEEIIVKFENSIKTAFHKINKEYEDFGYEFFYELDDCDARDLCDCNEYEFSEGGSLWTL